MTEALSTFNETEISDSMEAERGQNMFAKLDTESSTEQSTSLKTGKDEELQEYLEEANEPFEPKFEITDNEDQFQAKEFYQEFNSNGNAEAHSKKKQLLEQSPQSRRFLNKYGREVVDKLRSDHQIIGPLADYYRILRIEDSGEDDSIDDHHYWGLKDSEDFRPPSNPESFGEGHSTDEPSNEVGEPAQPHADALLKNEPKRVRRETDNDGMEIKREHRRSMKRKRSGRRKKKTGIGK